MERISTGQTFRSACIDMDIPYSTAKGWEIKNTYGWFDLSPHAYELGCDALADECIAIADDSGNDKQVLDDGREVTNNEVIQRSRLRIDTRLRLIGKWRPKKYGDKMQLSGDADNPIAITTVTRTIIDPKD